VDERKMRMRCVKEERKNRSSYEIELRLAYWRNILVSVGYPRQYAIKNKMMFYSGSYPLFPIQSITTI
jgi:hypothetical protein